MTKYNALIRAGILIIFTYISWPKYINRFFQCKKPSSMCFNQCFSTSNNFLVGCWLISGASTLLNWHHSFSDMCKGTTYRDQSDKRVSHEKRLKLAFHSQKSFLCMTDHSKSVFSCMDRKCKYLRFPCCIALESIINDKIKLFSCRFQG